MADYREFDDVAYVAGVPGAVAGVLGGGAAGSYLGSVNNVQRGRVRGQRALRFPAEKSRKS